MAMYMKPAPSADRYAAVRLAPAALGAVDADGRRGAVLRRVAGRGAGPRRSDRNDAHADGRADRRTVSAAAAGGSDAMNAPKSIFRQYDIRGLVGSELTPEFARCLGRAFATVAWDRLGRAPAIAVGRDNRPSGDALAGALRRGIVDAGGTAVDVGTLPDARALFRRASRSAPTAASRSPARTIRPSSTASRWCSAGDAFHGDELLELWEIIVAERWRSGAGRETQRWLRAATLSRRRSSSRHRLARPVRVVVDCGNGAGSLVAVGTLEALGAEVTPLFCESDGTFPNHHPDPTVPENLRDLQAEVRRTGAELGIAFDGDADRIGAVDETGRIVYGDQLLVILGRDAVRRFGPGTPVIFDVKCSEVLPTALARAGARPDHVEDGPLADQGQDEGGAGAPRGRDERPHVLRRRLPRIRRRAVRRGATARDREPTAVRAGSDC